ncbi:MAG: HEAT repeat domain-containing protein, partial [Asgard group archaeon]
ERVVEPLIEALKDEDNVVRMVAASTLSKIGDTRSIEALTQALKDEDEEVRKAAKKALEKIKAKKS